MVVDTGAGGVFRPQAEVRAGVRNVCRCVQIASDSRDGEGREWGGRAMRALEAELKPHITQGVLGTQGPGHSQVRGQDSSWWQEENRERRVLDTVSRAVLEEGRCDATCQHLIGW